MKPSELKKMTWALSQNIKAGLLDKVKDYVFSGGDLDEAVDDIPLMIAARHRRLEIAEFLIMAGASINKSSVWNVTALYEAASWGNSRLVELLIRHKAEVDSSVSSYYGPLMGAVYYGDDLGSIKLLLQAKADPINRDNFNRTILDRAVERARSGTGSLSMSEVNAKQQVFEEHFKAEEAEKKAKEEMEAAMESDVTFEIDAGSAEDTVGLVKKKITKDK